MNYSNMIEEKKLKKGFIIATLAATVIGTFTTSLNFYERVQDKRQSIKQKKVDDGQSNQIQELRAEVKKLQNGDDGGSKGGRSRSRSRSSSRSRNRRRRRKSVGFDEDEDFRRSAMRSRAMIEREYEDNFLRLGDKYAQGDVITENKLQAQIITLQQAVINVLQEALMDGRPLTKADIHRLVAAQESARDGSLEALRGQYQRLLPEKPSSRRLAIEEAPYAMPLQRQVTLPVEREESFAPPKRVKSMPIQSTSDHLYCGYSIDLQSSKASTGPAFSTGTCRCPDCGFRIPVSKQDVWSFEVRIPVGDGQIEQRIYEMDSRLVIKSHTPYGDYACVLCARERDRDCCIRTVDGLVEHLGRVHTSEEFEREWDMHRM